MKQIKNVIAVFALAIGLMLTQSCADPCKKVECGDNGTCVEGVCECNAGYEGDNCETEVRAQFLGTYTVSDACAPGTTYNSVISAVSSDVQKVSISNILGASLQGTATANVSGSSLTIPSQQVTDADGDNWTVSGSGSKSGSQVSLSVTSTFGTNDPVTCALTLSPQ